MADKRQDIWLSRPDVQEFAFALEYVEDIDVEGWDFDMMVSHAILAGVSAHAHTTPKWSYSHPDYLTDRARSGQYLLFYKGFMAIWRETYLEVQATGEEGQLPTSDVWPDVPFSEVPEPALRAMLVLATRHLKVW